METLEEVRTCGWGPERCQMAWSSQDIFTITTVTWITACFIMTQLVTLEENLWVGSWAMPNGLSVSGYLYHYNGYMDYCIHCYDSIGNIRGGANLWVGCWAMPNGLSVSGYLYHYNGYMDYCMLYYDTIGTTCATQQQQQLYHRATKISLKLNLRYCNRLMKEQFIIGRSICH
jgi:hypothetical protein